MKLSIQFISLAIALSGTLASAGVVHKHHGHVVHNHVRHAQPELVEREKKVVRVTRTVFVNQYGEPWPTPANNQDHVKIFDATTTSTSTSTSTSSTKTSTTRTSTTITSTTRTSTTRTSTTRTSTTSSARPTETKIEIEDPIGNGDPECDFPDGEVDCSTFPKEYGALPISWLHTGGWTGIQINGGAGDDCVDDALCSYACPPGYSKAQWPEMQPASGESHGGLLCRNGKLYKTNSAYKSLCVKGKGNVYVKNELSKNVPICRTDYPGSENMVVPLFSTAGSKLPLTVPDANTYYVWKGLPTSAQFYVNPQGTSLEDGCVWGIPDGGLGNWSPMIFGAGFHNGITWISISQNQLNSKPLNFNVKIVAAPGAKLNGNCKYENGVFSGGGDGEQGCTAALISGDAYFVLY
ncbi:hypothetical protein BDZ91DRAFT_657217 [Kalaharituber pfeilii]|nr:hypothetical protein BDZ91DRAFT_657217 [Kalaharituber pfeilii]